MLFLYKQTKEVLTQVTIYKYMLFMLIFNEFDLSFNLYRNVKFARYVYRANWSIAKYKNVTRSCNPLNGTYAEKC